MAKSFAENEPLYHPLITKSMERAQRNVEERNFEVRKHLLDFDSVLSKQRSLVYKQRAEILCAESLVKYLNERIEDIIVQNVQDKESADVIAFARERLLYNESLPQEVNHIQLIQTFQEDIQKKVQLVGEEIFTEIIRMEYLQLIDLRWQDHIEDLDNLRQAVYLRSYAQKNPLLEYNLEGFSLFDAMLENIELGVLRIIIGLRAENIRVSEDFAQSHGISEKSLMSQHSDFSLLSSEQRRGQSPASSAASTPAQARVVRTTEKVGRNAPCPCGSGKKYKFCCGRT